MGVLEAPISFQFSHDALQFGTSLGSKASETLIRIAIIPGEEEIKIRANASRPVEKVYITLHDVTLEPIFLSHTPQKAERHWLGKCVRESDDIAHVKYVCACIWEGGRGQMTSALHSVMGRVEVVSTPCYFDRHAVAGPDSTQPSR